MQNSIALGLEPRTSRVWIERDDHYTTEPFYTSNHKHRQYSMVHKNGQVNKEKAELFKQLDIFVNCVLAEQCIRIA